jgi:exopolyphosphatase/guanosine-5'-triphosphate,3'-diphosphate pyrophosphatase
VPPRHACIDVGSNTTRLLVAEPAPGGLREVAARRVFNRLGADVLAGEAIPPDRVEAVAEAVADQARLAGELGARPRAVATAAIRCAANAAELCAAVRERAGVELEVLTEGEEARLAFAGATRTLERAVEGEVAVVDVGGGSSEVAVGTVGHGARRWWSVPLGSGVLARECSDPPTSAQLDEVRRRAREAMSAVDVECPGLALAVGGSAASLRRLVGDRLDRRTIARAIADLAGGPAQEVARRFDLAVDRVRLLPAGILILAAAAERLGCPLAIGCGGLREGVVLEAMAEAPG